MKITIIGGGNMGGAIARGLTQGSLVKAGDITVVDFSQACLDNLKAFNKDINVSKEIAGTLSDADVVVFAVKPWQIGDVLNDVKYDLNYDKQLLISIAAGVPFELLNILLTKDDFDQTPVLFRVMPNTAIAVRESMTFIASYNAEPQHESLVADLFNELGKVIVISEEQMAAATALGSCGTAFAMRYIRAASEGGVELGFYPETAKNIVLQTVKGAAELLLSTSNHPESEIDKVTTPGGITIKGLNAMESGGFTSSVIQGLKAAKMN